MALIFLDSKNPSTRTEVREILYYIDLNPDIFILISRIFNSKRKPATQSTYEEIDGVIEETLNSPRYDLEVSLKTRLEDLLKGIYRSDRFSKIKSEILECVVFKYGPYTQGFIKHNVYFEPIIKDGDILVGNSSKIDSVFHTEDSEPLEFVECKTNIANVIPSNLPIDKLSNGDRRKVEYLINAFTYLSEKYCSPQIYMACYNVDYEDQLDNVQNNWGLSFFNILNPVQIYYSINEFPQFKRLNINH